MRKLSSVILAGIVMAFALFGCGESSSSDPINSSKSSDTDNTGDTDGTSNTGNISNTSAQKDDLQNYKNEISKLVDLENETKACYDNVTGDNYTNDAILYQALTSEIVPNSRKLVEQLEAIIPKTAELRDIHERIIAAWNLQNQAFILTQDAIENQDSSQVSNANEKLAEARKGIRDFHAELADYELSLTGNSIQPNQSLSRVSNSPIFTNDSSDEAGRIPPSKEPTSAESEDIVAIDYVLPHSANTYLIAGDLSHLSRTELRVARNEIYARHGFIFKSDDLDQYFRGKAWYKPTTPADNFSESVLSSIEKANINLIKQVEDRLS